MSKEEFRRRAVAFDTETHLIQPGLTAPPLVCGSWAWNNGERSELMNVPCTINEFECYLVNNDILVGANIAFDMAVMMEAGIPADAIFEKYNAGEVYDIQIAEMLNAIAGGHLGKDPRTGGDIIDQSTGKRGRYSLAACVDMVLGRKDAKQNDYWRLRYAILEKVPMGRWPEEARQYPVDDARNTLEVALAQACGCTQTLPGGLVVNTPGHRNLHDMPFQARAAFALHLASAHGFRTSKAKVDALEQNALEKRAKETEHWQKKGFLGTEDREGKKESRVVKAALARAYGAHKACPTCQGEGKIDKGKVFCTNKNIASRKLEGNGCDGTGLDLSDAPMLARTPTGGIQAGRDLLSDSGDEDLIDFAEYQEDDKLLNVYVPFLRKGTEGPLNPRPNVLVASGRTSYDEVMQQMPRKGGVRECFEPRPGYVYCSTDYSSGELCTLAQVTLWTVGHSKMAEVINESKDPGALHTAYGAKLVGVEPAELTKRIKAGDKQAAGFRQAAKALNFGLPGGMGAAKLVLSKRKKNEGETEGPDGKKYIGIRFCILVGGAEKCGIEKIVEWRGRACAPVCKRCVELAEALKQEWLGFFTEMPAYFDWVSKNVDAGGELTQFVSNRVRGGLSFCDGANTMFQGLLADGAKRALWYITEEMYVDRNSPLYGNRVNAFFHDETFSELREETAHLAGPRQAELMVKGLKECVPDVYVECLPALMRYWSKDAKTLYDENKKLIVWEG